ncbi:MAG: murein biosynthesis integral membrane protein MurJ [Phycisphaerae bacterium]|nr:murein biosynthesis integral membrane protein MurJ [Phycisphaerae bacterium]
MSQERPVVSSAVQIGVCTLASRITGLVRDMLIVQAFGLSWVQDAFTYAFQIPNLFRRLFGEGALAAVFVPTFTRTMEHEGRPAAWRLMAGTLALLTVALIVVILVLEGIVGVVWLMSNTGTESAAARQLLLALTALMLPFMLGICVVALFASVLNSVGSFVPAALTPIILNVFMIAGILWLGPAVGGPAPEQQVFGVALSVLVASVVQLVFILPVLRAKGVKLGWRWAPADPAVRKSLTLMGPVILGQGVLALGVFLDAQICALFTHVHNTPEFANWFGLTFRYPLSEGALSALTVASRLYQFPLGVFAVSLGTAALPAFSRLAAREQWSDWLGEVRGALRMALFVGLLAGGMMVLIPDALIRLLFEYRAFDAADTQRAARVLICYGFGMWAFCVHHIVLRAFYSTGDVQTPLRISCALLPVNLGISLVLIWFSDVREAAFAISSAITSAATIIVGLVLLQRRAHGAVIDRVTLLAAGRMLVAAIVAGVVLHGARQVWSPWLDTQAIAHRAIDSCAAMILGSVAYVGMAWLLRLPEPGLLLKFPRRRATRR